jgi:ribonuclease Z
VPAVGYSFIEKMRPGVFNKSKALKLGVPEGPLFSKIQQGLSIKLENGKKITPDMILGPPRKGRKIVISGDTRPFKEMIEYAKDADILVHEATFDSNLEDISSDYGHTTTAEAAEIAKKSNVKKLFLTHISPRYLNDYLFEKEAKKIFKNSFVPKDFDEVEINLDK